MMIKLSTCGGGGFFRKLTEIDNNHGNQKRIKNLIRVQHFLNLNENVTSHD